MCSITYMYTWVNIYLNFNANIFQTIKCKFSSLKIEIIFDFTIKKQR